MPRKKIKEEIRKPDILIRAIENALMLVRTHYKLCIIALAAICLIGVSVYGYAAYQDKKNEKAQSQLFDGIKSLEEFNTTGKKESLEKASEVFQKVIALKRGNISKTAKLYLSTVYATKGRNEEARKILTELSKDESDLLAAIATKTLQHMDTK